jgi:predicted amino acid dehydrogenase
MKKFAFLTHPLSLSEANSFWPWVRFIPAGLERTFFGRRRALRVMPLDNIVSAQAGRIEGFLLVEPFLPRRGQCCDEDYLLSRISEAAKQAQQLGAAILGLGGCFAWVADYQDKLLSRKLNIALTSGSALLAWSAFETIFSQLKTRKKEIREAHFLLNGSASAAGLLCAKKISEYAPARIIVSDTLPNLTYLKEALAGLGAFEILPTEELPAQVGKMDIIILAGQWRFPLAGQRLKADALVCDISFCEGTASGLNSVNYIRAGRIKLPAGNKLSISSLPEAIVAASLAETILLTFEERFVNYSLGRKINLDKMEGIADLAARHGFNVELPQALVL